jgi:hypothetical protein
MWRAVRPSDVEARTFSRQLVHRWRWGCQPYSPAALYPQEDSSFAFLLEAESTPGRYYSWKEWVNWKIQWPHQESNPQPSGLYRNASTNYNTASSITKVHTHINSFHLLYCSVFRTISHLSVKLFKIRPRRTAFEPGSGHVGFSVDKVVHGKIFSKYFGSPYQSSFHQLLHNHHHLSYGAGTVGQ